MAARPDSPLEKDADSDGEDLNALCEQFFEKCVCKEKAKADLPKKEKQVGKATTMKKMIEGAKGSKDTVRYCESSIAPKHQDPKTKTISSKKFIKHVLPEIAAKEAKCKSADEPKAKTQLRTMKKNIRAELQKGDKTQKVDATTSRLTDTSKYTGAHKERFDADGKGKGSDGRVDKVDSSGYVGNYKGKDTFDKKK